MRILRLVSIILSVYVFFIKLACVGHKCLFLSLSSFFFTFHLAGDVIP